MTNGLYNSSFRIKALLLRSEDVFSSNYTGSILLNNLKNSKSMTDIDEK